MNPTQTILLLFEKISAVPRGSKNEAAISAWIQGWAEEHQFRSRSDAVGNLAIYVPASEGCEGIPPVILQGHMDMVCQKTALSKHDFLKDPIRLVVDGDWIRTDETTLGADNGIGLAIAMAIATSAELSHPPLELLFTVEEEVGLAGADKIDPVLLTGKTLVNLDSETEGKFTIGCAGGQVATLLLPVTWQEIPTGLDTIELKIGGLKGGHSGEDIQKHRANANKILTRALDEYSHHEPVFISHWQGGTARNAIPREAVAHLACSPEQIPVLYNHMQDLMTRLRTEFGQTDPGLQISVLPCNESSNRMVLGSDSLQIVRLMAALPNGVYETSVMIDGFVETSNNLGVVELKEDGLHIVSNQRSSLVSQLDELIGRVEAVAQLAGARISISKRMEPWKPNMQSPLLTRSQLVYERTFGVAPQLVLTHGGLECGLLSRRCGGLDALSLGPTLQNLHSPEERLFVPSIERVWLFLRALLESYKGD